LVQACCLRQLFEAKGGRTEPGAVSAYVTVALRRQLERDGIEDLIAQLVEVNGPLDDVVVARYVDEWR
jgi:hypothetical protein